MASIAANKNSASLRHVCPSCISEKKCHWLDRIHLHRAQLPGPRVLPQNAACRRICHPCGGRVLIPNQLCEADSERDVPRDKGVQRECLAKVWRRQPALRIHSVGRIVSPRRIGAWQAVCFYAVPDSLKNVLPVLLAIVFKPLEAKSMLT